MRKNTPSQFKLASFDTPSNSALLNQISSPDFQFDFALLSESQNLLLKTYLLKKLTHQRIDFDQKQRRMISDIHKRIKAFQKRLENLQKLQIEANCLASIFDIIEKTKE